MNAPWVFRHLGKILLVACALLTMVNAPGSAESVDILAEIGNLQKSSGTPYIICKNQTYALCATAPTFVYQQIAYAKCQIKHGDSISAPPLYYPPDIMPQKNICDFNAEGVGNGYMASTYSVPPSILKRNPRADQAVYTCPGGSDGDYAQCDGGTCFTSTSGKTFPGLGKLNQDQIICSCPITKATTSNAPFGYQFVGPYPCRKEAFAACTQSGANTSNGSRIPVGSPPGAGRFLMIKLTGQDLALNGCFSR